MKAERQVMLSRKSAMRKYMSHMTIQMNPETTGVRELDLTHRRDGLDSVADSMETSAIETVYLTLLADQATV